MIPENLRLLHHNEEVLQEKSVEAITSSDELSHHLRIIECSMDVLNYFSTKHSTTGDDKITLKLLGIRLFNDIAAALKLAMSGYYQGSAQIQRDILETSFLLDFFKAHPSRVAEWRSCERAERMKNFSPSAVRKAIDARDGFEGKKRDEHYQLLSELGAHPTPLGFNMLRPTPDSDAHCGAFFEQRSLVAVLSEPAKLAVQAGGIFRGQFEPKVREDFEMIVGFAEAQGPWFRRFFGRSNVTEAELAELRRLLAEI